MSEPFDQGTELHTAHDATTLVAFALAVVAVVLALVAIVLAAVAL